MWKRNIIKMVHNFFYRINISEVHAVYQMLEEEDNIRFMTMIDASTQKNETNDIYNYTENKPDNSIVSPTDPEERKVNQNQVLIKTETRTGYVNIDGSEREKVNNESILKEIVKERITAINGTGKAELIEKVDSTPVEETQSSNVEVDDIIVPEAPVDEDIQLPSTSKSKDTFKLLPKVIQDFLNTDWKSRAKCEPQRLLERIRKEKIYPDHPDVGKYELLLTPAPSFLQRISLAGEFLNKKQLEL